MKKNRVSPKSKTKVIASRKRCTAKGTGLSHYILIEKSEAKKENRKKA